MRNRRPLGRAPAPDRHLEGVDDELGADVVGDGPAHHPTAPGVDDDGQVALALWGGVLGDVHHPEAVRSFGVERTLHQVLGRLGGGVTSGAAPALAPIDARDARLAHEALDALFRAAGVLAQVKLGMDPRRAIGAPAHAVDVDDRVGQEGVVEVLVADRVGLPGIEARGRHLHHPTTGRHGQVRAGLGDEDVDHFGRAWSLAK